MYCQLWTNRWDELMVVWHCREKEKWRTEAGDGQPTDDGCGRPGRPGRPPADAASSSPGRRSRPAVNGPAIGWATTPLAGRTCIRPSSVSWRKRRGCDRPFRSRNLPSLPWPAERTLWLTVDCKFLLAPPHWNNQSAVWTWPFFFHADWIVDVDSIRFVRVAQ